MRKMQRYGWAVPALVLSCLSAWGADAPGSSGIAARVNGQPIPESAVQRALEHVPPAKHDEARKEVLDHIIETVLIDQYVLQLPQFTASKEEIDKKEEVVRAELLQQKKDLNKWLEEMKFTEAELRQEIAADVRWNKFCDAQATDARLKQLFDSETECFQRLAGPRPPHPLDAGHDRPQSD